MAKKVSKISDVFQSVNGLGHALLEETPRKVTNNASTMMASTEREAIIRKVANASLPSDLDEQEPLRYAVDLSKRMSLTRKDNLEIRKLTPEIGQAQAIMIPSILSPTTLQDSKIQFQSACPDISAEENDRVSQIVTGYFNDTLKINVKMGEWIGESLYGAGSRPLLTIPIAELDDLINNPAFQVKKEDAPTDQKVALEAFMTKYREKSGAHCLFGIGDGEVNSEHVPLTGAAIESIYDSFAETASKLKQAYDGLKPDQKKSSISKGSPILDEISKDVLATESFGITDNINVLSSRAFQSAALERLEDKVKTHYKESSYVSLSDQHKSTVGHPLFMELPPESVMPIYTPGTPADHLGYFVLIDESGNPVSLQQLNEESQKPINIQKRSTFDNLFKAFGFEDLRTYGNVESTVMNEIYRQIIDAHLKRRLQNNGLINVELGSDNAVYQAMFTRYLQKRKTRLLFVPKAFITYFCFYYNENGTGRSTLEDMKFVLSLRITALVCRMMTLMNNSVDRRNLVLNLPPNSRVPNPVQFLEDIKREYMMKSLVTFSYDPNEVNRSMAQRGLAVKIKGMPGIPDYDLTNEPNTRSGGDFDDRLIDEIKNMLIMDLKTPPSAFNATAENEYSRSVATTNLFYARTIGQYQTVACEKGTHFVRQYVGLSKVLQEKIIEAVREVRKAGKDKVATEAAGGERNETIDDGLGESDIAKLKDPKKKAKSKAAKKDDEEKIVDDKNAGTVEEEADKLNDFQLLKSILAHVEMVLPKPEVAPDKAQFDELESFVTAINTMVDSIYSDELFATDTNMKEAAATIRALVKSDIIQEHLRRAGLGANIKLPDFTNFLSDKILDIHQTARNLTTALAKQKEYTTPPGSEDGAGLGGDVGGGSGSQTF